MIKALRTSTAIVMAGCLAVPLYAQLAPDAGAVRALSSARSLKCSFPWYSSADWNDDRPTLKNATQTDFGFHIDGIDYGKGVARLIGNAGAEDLTPVRGDSSVSFIERVPVGTLNVTTVYAWRNKAGHFKAVHSRHTAIGGPSPSQNYGSCEPW
jgi:hypothetical protein